ncbi:Gfo/Idh/MocA family oxidoreductase [Candidatus Gottesmanbacteria bacterium]|nr:Gfo/Idh/MocA family oxidoreductase [Candidatus Gottesmanbacteria bacterium]
MNKKGSVGVALIGYGYWGQKLFRSFEALPTARVETVCDRTVAYQEAIRNNRVQAVIVATPPSTHYEIASYALTRGKHVFIEKPMTKTTEEASKLIKLAQQKRLTLLVDHTYVYAKPIQKIQELIAEGALGTIYFVESTRTNLGRFSLDSDVLWDLGPHDVSICNYILQKTPTAVFCQGSSHVIFGLRDRADLRLVYAGGIDAYIRVSWLSPIKERRLTIVGAQKMLVYDDVAANDEIRIYDCSVSIKKNSKQKQTNFRYVDGNVSVIRVPHKEPLLEACADFTECIQTGSRPRVSGEDGRRVVQILELQFKLQYADSVLEKRGT